MYYNTTLFFVFIPLIYIITAISIFFYLKKALLLISSHETGIRDNYSSLFSVSLDWLYKQIHYFRIFMLLWIPFYGLFLLFIGFHWYNWIVIILLFTFLLAITYLTYWIGLVGWRQTSVLQIGKKTNRVNISNYQNVSEERIQDLKHKIIYLMEECRLFLDENLTLSGLAKELNEDPNLISFVLNQHLAKSFFDFVNHYRVEMVKSKLNDPNFNHLSVLGIAYDSGFNSKSSFNRVFKKITGMTPSQFKKNSG